MKIDLQRFTRETLDQIPVLRCMQPRFSQFDSLSLRLHAPLAANINDKHTAFGGSIAALATVAGWALTTLIARQAGHHCDVVVACSQLNYKAPVDADFYFLARTAAAARETLLSALAAGDKGRLDVDVAVMLGQRVMAEFNGEYVAG